MAEYNNSNVVKYFFLDCNFGEARQERVVSSEVILM